MAFELDSDTKPVTLKAFKGYDGAPIGHHIYKIGKYKEQKVSLD